jgi:hypothetical protein
MIQKRFVRSRQVCKITFAVPEAELPDKLDIDALYIVGDFNEWHETATPMKRNRKGVYRATIELLPGQDTQFRYLANGEHWFNGWDADDYVPNDFGSENCLLIAFGEDVVISA